MNIQNKTNNSTIILIVAIFILLTIVGFLSFQIVRIKSNEAKDEKQLEEIEKQKVYDKVSKILYFESKKDFTLATIKDIQGLKTQDPEFYNYAKNGDKLMIFEDRAVIYREEKNQIINISRLAESESNNESK